ncbi:MAG: hypothetical protein OCC45_06315 [Desulfotalea sp.]
MSTKKTTAWQIESIVSRLKKHYKVSEDIEIARIMGMKKGNFSSKKISGSLINDIAIFCINKEIDCNKILLGKTGNERYTILKEMEEWLDHKTNDRKKSEIWFSVDREKYFKEFLSWRNEKKIQENNKNRFQEEVA